MAISNNICTGCDHVGVCSKQTTLSKFNDENSKNIGMDIKIEKCNDYKEAE